MGIKETTEKKTEIEIDDSENIKKLTEKQNISRTRYCKKKKKNLIF